MGFAHAHQGSALDPGSRYPLAINTTTSRQVITGAEIFLREPPDIARGKRIGLITNPGAVDSRVRQTMDLFAEASARGASGGWRLTRLFGPEHGLRGDYPAGAKVPDTIDPFTGIPISSLYGDHRAPTRESLEDVDVLVVDLPQVGVRFYTKTSTMANSLIAAAEHGRPIVVLDRPNPIGGVEVEGPPVEKRFESFLGRVGWPIRLGVTLGELARVVNDGEGIGADLTVVKCEGWARHEWWDATALPWVLPSPNMPTLDTATVYPGTCLFEGTLLSEGRGTTRPFELIGAPWVEPYKWVDALAERKLPGVTFRPQWFQPVYHKHKEIPCGGLQVHVTDRDVFRPAATAIHMIETARDLWPKEFGWRAPYREGAIRAIDRLYGSAALREMMDSGATADEAIKTWDASPFKAQREKALLY